MKNIFIILLLVSLAFSSCEKDDICAGDTPTTPQLVIEFFNDVTNASQAVSKLKIVDTETSKILGVFNDAKIKIPLKTDVDISKYSLILNFESTVVGAENTDKIDINYTRNSVYISRACGYKTNFSLDKTKPILVAETPSIPATEWIKRITITKPNILNEDETHIKIYF